jgi:cytochrome b561
VQDTDSIDAYDAMTRKLHWVSAFLFLFLFFLGLGIDWVPRGEPRVMVRSVHITLGALLTLLLVYRLFWKTRFAQSPDPLEGGIDGPGVRLFHALLYLIMIAMVGSGIVAVWFRGVNLFDVLTLEPFDASNKPMRRLLVNIHEVIAYSLMALSGGHALMALWHHVRLKDGCCNACGRACLSVDLRCWRALQKLG